MFNSFKNSSRNLIMALLPSLKPENGQDPVTPNHKAPILIDKEREETGWNRLYMMFSTSEFGEPSPQLATITQTLMMSFVVGGAIGGFVHSRNAFMNFVDRNDATSFSNHMDAKNKLQDKVTVGFGKGAWKWGWRLTAFTGSYTIISNSIAAYRGKDGILEHTMAGIVTGAGYKVNIGLRGVVVGGTLGGVLGTICGITTKGILKLTGTNMDEVRRPSVAFQHRRDNFYKKASEEKIKQEDGELAAAHDARIGQVTLNLDNIKIETNT